MAEAGAVGAAAVKSAAGMATPVVGTVAGAIMRVASLSHRQLRKFIRNRPPPNRDGAGANAVVGVAMLGQNLCLRRHRKCSSRHRRIRDGAASIRTINLAADGVAAVGVAGLGLSLCQQQRHKFSSRHRRSRAGAAALVPMLTGMPEAEGKVTTTLGKAASRAAPGRVGIVMWDVRRGAAEIVTADNKPGAAAEAGVKTTEAGAAVEAGVKATTNGATTNGAMIAAIRTGTGIGARTTAITGRAIATTTAISSG
jgi:hypothetical protein